MYANERIFTIVYALYNFYFGGGAGDTATGWLVTNPLVGHPMLKWLAVGFHSGFIQKFLPDDIKNLYGLLSDDEKDAIEELGNEAQNIIGQQEKQVQNVKALLQGEDLQRFDNMMSSEESTSIYNSLTQKILDSNDPEFIKEQTRYIQQCIDVRNLIVSSISNKSSGMTPYRQYEILTLFDGMLTKDPNSRNVSLLEGIMKSGGDSRMIEKILDNVSTGNDDSSGFKSQYDEQSNEDQSANSQPGFKSQYEDEYINPQTNESNKGNTNRDTPAGKQEKSTKEKVMEEGPYSKIDVGTTIQDLDTKKLMVVAKDKNGVKYLKIKE